VTTPLALGLLGVGLVLMVSAYRNESPIDAFLIALGRGPSSPAQLGKGGATLGLAAPSTKGTPGASGFGPAGGGTGGGGGGGGGGSW